MGMIKDNVRPFYQIDKEYWRIRQFAEISKNRLNVILDCYQTKNEFMNYKPSIDSYQFDVDTGELTIINSDIRQALYVYAQDELSYFTGVTLDIGD